MKPAGGERRPQDRCDMGTLAPASTPWPG